MNKWISTIVVAVASVLAVVFIILKNFDWAVFSITIMFAFSNIFRAKTFKEQGDLREAKWMQMTGMVFALAAVVVLVMILIK